MSIQAKENCYATMYSYMEICVGCGCCERGAYKERLEYHQEQLNQHISFNNWFLDKEGRLVQKQNLKKAIKHEKAKIRQLKMKIKERHD